MTPSDLQMAAWPRNGISHDKHGMVVHTMQNGKSFREGSIPNGLVSMVNDIYNTKFGMDLIKYVVQLDQSKCTEHQLQVLKLADK
jgi:hypothetical protein